MSIQEIIAAIKEMKMTEVKELVDAMKEEFGVTGAIAVAGGPAAAAAPVEEEKTEFDVILKSVDPAQKIKVIKVVREVVAGLGLKEAKEIVEAAPKIIKEGVSKEDAAKIVAQFKEVGAECEVK